MSGNPGPSRMHPDDPGFEKWCTDLLEDEDCVISDEDEDPDFIIESEHDSDSEMSAGEEGDENLDTGPGGAQTQENFYYGRQKLQKDKTKWSKETPPLNIRTRKHNIVMSVPGVRGPAKNLGDAPSAEELWNLLFTQDMLEEIIRWTNTKLAHCRQKYKNKAHYSLSDSDLLEFKAFLGLLIYTEVFKSGNESVHSLFATDGTGRDVFRCVMSKRRFLTLLSALRFDNFLDRGERQEEDPAAAISHLFNRFIENSQNNFSLGVYVCVDESLVAFRGRYARNNYLYNAYIYSGKGSDGKTLTAQEQQLKIPTQSVIQLVKPIEKTNRNVTADNWFGSLELVLELQKRGLTFLGTLRKNKPEVPQCFLPNKNKEVKSSLYGFHQKNITLLSYVVKKNKGVVLISSMHHSEENDPETEKPQIIADYNLTKGGVDSLDRKCANYSPSRRTRRWPMAIFLMMVNFSSVNAYILHQSQRKPQNLHRLDFLKKLAKSLTAPYMQKRFHTQNLSTEVRSRIAAILQISNLNQEHQMHNDERLPLKKTCYLCPYRLKRKTFYMCRECEKPICLEHAKKMCSTCVDITQAIVLTFRFNGCYLVNLD